MEQLREDNGNVLEDEVSSYCDNIHQYTAIKSILLGEELTQEEFSTIKAFKCVQDFLDLPMNDPQEGDLKKLFAGAIIAGSEQGILPFELPNDSGEAIASMVDEGLTRVKTIYKVATQEFSIEDAIDAEIEHETAKGVAIIDFALDSGIAGEAIADIASAICPPLVGVAPFIKEVVNYAAPEIKEVVHKYAPAVASKTKQLVHNAINTAKEKGKKIIEKLFG